MTSIIKKFRVLFIIGLMLLFTSLFLEWYILQAFNAKKILIAYWSFNPLTEWSTRFSETAAFNNLIKPNDLHIPIIIIVLFILLLVCSLYSVIFKNFEEKIEIEKLTFYAYILIFLLTLNLYFIFLFPILYLIPNELYFPFLLIKDRELNVTFYYAIGPGYLLQIVGFILFFPYSLFYYKTVFKFKSEKGSSESIIANLMQRIRHPIDLDELIAKEKLKLKLNDKNLADLDDVNKNFTEMMEQEVM